MAITESFGRGRIAESILDTTAVPFTLKISKVPVTDNQFITINPDTTREEIFFYTTTTWTAWEAWTLNVTWRWYNVNNDTQASGNQNQHDENSEYKLALNHIIINDKVDMKLNNVVESEIKFNSTTEHGLVVNNMTTTERDAITAENWNIIYNSTTNVLQQYISWAWSDIGSTWVADASETVAGKVEMATNAEAIAWTDVWSTWAPLAIKPSQLVAATPSATTTTEGLVELATDAEALAWTDETRYINSKQAKDNYEQLVNVSNFTRDLSTATWTLVIAHGLAKAPKKISFIYSTDSTSLWPWLWVSVWTWINMTIWINQSIDDTFNGTHCIVFWNTTAYNRVSVTAIDATNFTLTWTKTGSPTWTLNVIWTAEA